MAEQLLDDPQVGPTVEQVGREGMPQRVRRDADRQAGPRAETVEAVAEAADAEGPPRWFRKISTGGGSASADRASRTGRPSSR